MLCCVCFTFVNVTSATNIAERSSLLATAQSYQSVREPGWISSHLRVTNTNVCLCVNVTSIATKTPG